MDATAIAAAAARLAENRRTGAALVGLPDGCRPETEDDAYAVQDDMNALLGEQGFGAAAGWKVGCTTPVMQQYMGIDHPGAGSILAKTVHESPVSLRHVDFVAVGVEGEIAVRLASELAPADAPFDRAGVAAAVGECMAAIELVDARYANYRSLDTWTMVADNFFNAGAVLAAPCADWRSLDLRETTGRMTLKGRPAGRGTGAAVMGHPFESVAWLANTLARRGRGIKAGEIILTGSIVETQWLDAGDSVQFEVDRLGTVSITVTA